MFDTQTSAMAAQFGSGSATACPAKLVPIAIIGIPPMMSGMSGKSNPQPPSPGECSSTKPAKLDVPTLVLLWRLVLGVWMFLTEVCRVSHCPAMGLKVNKGKRAKKIRNFFSGTLMANHWEKE